MSIVAEDERGISQSRPLYTSARSPRKRGLLGDIVVIRTEGHVGPESLQHGWFRSMALYELGDVSYGNVYDTCFFEQAIKLADSVSFVALTKRSHRELLARGRQPMGGRPVMMRPEMYRIPESRDHGLIVEFDNGEYVRCEQSGDSFALSWSTALPLLEILDGGIIPIEYRAQMGHGEVSLAQEMKNGDTWFEGDIGKVADIVRDRLASVTYLRMDSPAVAVAWRRNIGVAATANIPLHECFVISTSYERQMLRPMIEESATPAVAEHVDELLLSMDKTLYRYAS